MAKFSDLLNELRRCGDEWSVTIGDDWLQGRAIYGGLVAALCVHACTLEETDLPQLRSAHFAFVGPAIGRLKVRPTMLRRGKSAVFARVELAGELGLATQATLCFAANRLSSLVHNSIVYPSARPPKECPSVFDGAPRSLAFVQHIEGRLAAGHPPFSEAMPEMAVWVRHRDMLAPSSLASLFALADAPPPAALVLASGPGPISTITWSIDILSTNLETNEGWWLVKTTAETVADGYSTQLMMLWSAAGTPIMSSRQNLALFL